MTVSKKHIIQAGNAVAYTMDHGDFSATNVSINRGGFLNCKGGGSITLSRVWSDGAPSGGGVYFIITSTNPVGFLKWDNTGIDKWITNGAEAGLRLMQCREALVIGVKFKCRKQANGKYWKGIVADRSDGPDADNGHGTHEYRNCTFVGPNDLGAQADPSGAKQRVREIVFRDCSFTEWPRISRCKTNGKSGIGSVQYINCKIAGSTVNKVITPDKNVKKTLKP